MGEEKGGRDPPRSRAGLPASQPPGSVAGRLERSRTAPPRAVKPRPNLPDKLGPIIPLPCAEKFSMGGGAKGSEFVVPQTPTRGGPISGPEGDPFSHVNGDLRAKSNFSVKFFWDGL